MGCFVATTIAKATHVAPRLKKPQQKFYGRYQEMIDRYEISISKTTMNLFPSCRFFILLSSTSVLPDLTMSNTVGALYETGTAYPSRAPRVHLPFTSTYGSLTLHEHQGFTYPSRAPRVHLPSTST